MTAKEVSEQVWRLFYNHEIKIKNAYLYYHESDWLSITKSDYIYEVEIKISRSDFFADFKKENKHRCLLNPNKIIPFKSYELTNIKSIIHFVEANKQIPNKFFYACPENLIKINDVPNYAGLIYTSNNPRIVKNAPYLHRNKFTEWKRLAQLLFYRINN